MPIYEYYCPDNNKIYQFYAKTIAQGQTIPACPDNPEFRMMKVLSTFAISKGGKASADADDSGTDTNSGDLDDAKLDAAFSQMEQEMSGVDENDPKAMARMMRRMSELTGERLGGEMEEVVRRLEGGQDPEKIEEELGDAFGDEMDEAGGSGPRSIPGSAGRMPVRDPKLYDY